MVRFREWDFVTMMVLLTGVLVFEFLGVFTDKGYVTITSLIRQYVPMWGRAMFLGWLVYHFSK